MQKLHGSAITARFLLILSLLDFVKPFLFRPRNVAWRFEFKFLSGAPPGQRPEQCSSFLQLSQTLKPFIQTIEV